MEQILIKLAKQLDALDEASLMSLWDKYSRVAAQFEPSKRWEESVLVLSLIQAKKWKNQLFNQQWAAQRRPDKDFDLSVSKKFSIEPEQTSSSDGKVIKKAKTLPFKLQKQEENNE